MSENKYPEGWDEGKVQRVLAYYEGQTEEETLLEDEAVGRHSETVISLAVESPHVESAPFSLLQRDPHSTIPVECSAHY